MGSARVQDICRIDSKVLQIQRLNPNSLSKEGCEKWPLQLTILDKFVGELED
jgi:hypothetical protein